MMANMQVSLVDDPHAWALLLDPDGFIAEGTGANFFIVTDGELWTPEPRNILRGLKQALPLDPTHTSLTQASRRQGFRVYFTCQRPLTGKQERGLCFETPGL